ncbi:MAG: YSC84-related protein [Gammaproteobacteria bacterium]
MLRIILVIFTFAIFTGVGHADEVSDTISEFKQSPRAMEFFGNSYAYAVFPKVGKGAVLVGGAHGKGIMFQDGVRVGNITLNQISVGGQLGGQTDSQISFIQNKKAYDDFTSGSFEFGAQASAVAVRAGANASAGTTGSTGGASSPSGIELKGVYTQGVATFIINKGGLMVEGALAGQTFTFEPG